MINNPDEYETMNSEEYLHHHTFGTILAQAKDHSGKYFHRVDLHSNDFYLWWECQNCPTKHTIYATSYSDL